MWSLEKPVMYDPLSATLVVQSREGHYLIKRLQTSMKIGEKYQSIPFEKFIVSLDFLTYWT